MHPRPACLLILLVLVIASCNRSGAGMEPSPVRGRPAEVAVVREILGQMVDPPGAAGRRLTLVRYTIPPGVELAPHVHPGVQMAFIESGTLSYRVESGTVVIHRGVDADGIPSNVEQVTGPADTALHAGDTVIEEGDMVHFGANRTDRSVSILATLVTEGAGLSVAADVPSPPFPR